MVCVLCAEPNAEAKPWVAALLLDRPASEPAGLRAAAAALVTQAPDVAIVTAAPLGYPVSGCREISAAPGCGGEPLCALLLAGLDWAAAQARETSWLLTVPVSAPPAAADLGSRMATAIAGSRADVALAAAGGELVWGAGFWPVAAREPLRRLALCGVETPVRAWITSLTPAIVPF